MFAQQRVRLFFPHRDFCNGAIAERILSRLVDVVQIAPGYIHGALIVERRYSSRSFAVRIVLQPCELMRGHLLSVAFVSAAFISAAPVALELSEVHPVC